MKSQSARPTRQNRNTQTTAGNYTAIRPKYFPLAVHWIRDYFRSVTGESRAEVTIDAGCGSGQVTVPLAEFSDRVVGIDFSEEMLQLARRQSARPNINYYHGDVRQLPEVYTGTGAPAADLLVAGLSAHYFDCDAFYDGVKQVVRPGGVVAAFGYYFSGFDNPGLEDVLDKFFDEVTTEKEQRALWMKVREEFLTLHFPFSNKQYRKEEVTFPMTRSDVMKILSSLSPMFKSGERNVEEFMENVLPVLDNDRFGLNLQVFALMARV